MYRGRSQLYVIIDLHTYTWNKEKYYQVWVLYYSVVFTSAIFNKLFK
jgi:hypothetical protein